MDQTPEQVREDLDSLTREFSNIEITMGRRTRPGTSSSSQRIPPAPTPRRTDAGRLEDLTREDGVSQRGASTAHQQASTAYQKGGRMAASLSYTPDAVPRMTAVERYEAITRGTAEERYEAFTPSERASMARQSGGAPTVRQPMMHRDDSIVPATEARRNITNRRSRGRKEESVRDLETLMKKRTKGRSRDRRYTRQSLGQSLSGEEIRIRAKARLAAEMELRTADRIDQLRTDSKSTTQSESSSSVQARTNRMPCFRRPPFLRRDIPSREENSDVHAQLMDLLAIRQQFQEDQEEASYDGDMVQEDYSEQQYMNINEQMYVIYDSYVHKKDAFGGVDLVLGGHPASSEKQSTPIRSVYLSVDELPAPTDYERTAQGQFTPRHPACTIPVAVAKDQFTPKRPGRTIPVAVASPLCPSSQLPFRIWFVYSEDETPMTIWDSISNFNLYAFALNWVTQNVPGGLFEIGFDPDEGCRSYYYPTHWGGV